MRRYLPPLGTTLGRRRAAHIATARTADAAVAGPWLALLAPPAAHLATTVVGLLVGLVIGLLAVRTGA